MKRLALDRLLYCFGFHKMVNSCSLRPSCGTYKEMIMANKKREKNKVEKVMKEFKNHELHSGSKKGPEVTNKKQAIAIALHESGQSRKSKKKK